MNVPIEVNRARKRYGRSLALADVSLTVPEGCVFALLGENGAGKSTLIKLLLDLAEPDAGRLTVLGLDSQRNGEQIRRQVGYVPERPTLYEWMTAAQIGWFTAGFYGDGYEVNYRQLLEGFAIPANRKLKHLSKGMRAKVVLALAMAHNPKLLVLDEPTSGLDTMVRREFLESMVDQAATGRTVLLSSHQISEVERVADWVAMLHEGKLLTVARLDELKATTHQWTITVDHPSVRPPELEGEVLDRRRDGRQWRIIVRVPHAETVDPTERLLATDSVVAVDRSTPNLEEIFLAYMRGEATTSADGEFTTKNTKTTKA